MVSSGKCSKPAQARRAPRSPEMLHWLLCALSTHQPQCCRCSWAGRGVQKHRVLPCGGSRCFRRSHGPKPNLLLAAEPNSSFCFGSSREPNKRRKPRELNTHTSHHIAPQHRQRWSMYVPAPLTTARQSHLISAPSSCPSAAPVPQETTRSNTRLHRPNQGQKWKL